MHFSIPDTQEAVEKSGNPYVVYNINVNGINHCSLRYRQLCHFHDQLKKSFGSNILPFFPPKKLLPLNQQQIEERRVLLEKYTQEVSQNVKITSSDVFQGFFLAAQVESLKALTEPVSLQVYLSSKNSFSVDFKSTDSSTHVLRQILTQQLDLPEKFLSYFDLLVLQVTKTTGSRTSGRVVRKLQGFEAPFLTIASLNKMTGTRHVLCIRKSYWDSAYDEQLMSCEAGITLLYYQSLHDFEQGRMTSIPKEVRHQLSQFEQQDRKRDFLNLIRTMKFYSYIHFDDCISDFPGVGTKVAISIGANELVMRPVNHDFKTSNEDCPSPLPKEYVFSVTRIRCWRLTTDESLLRRSSEMSTSNLQGKQLRPELSFQYLMGRENLRWIVVDSDQSVLMSMCLQSIVKELLLKRKGMSLGSNSLLSSSSSASLTSSVSSKNSSWSFLRKESRSQETLSNCSSQESIASSLNGNHNNHQESRGIKYNARIRRVENDAFDGIGDDDL